MSAGEGEKWTWVGTGEERVGWQVREGGKAKKEEEASETHTHRH